jgi:hypothetical protein
MEGQLSAGQLLGEYQNLRAVRCKLRVVPDMLINLQYNELHAL